MLSLLFTTYIQRKKFKKVLTEVIIGIQSKERTINISFVDATVLIVENLEDVSQSSGSKQKKKIDRY